MVSGPGVCAHDVCDIGLALTSGCDTCVTDVCSFDDYCCQVEWDDLCVEEAGDFCGAACTPPVLPIQPGDLIITEIMNNPDAVFDNAGEWFEVYNNSANAVA